MKYYQTPLEDWVTRFYRNFRITEPDDLTEENLCFLLHIYLYRKPIGSSSYEVGSYRSITLDSRLSPAEQREQFFHELCHILRYYGRQAGLSKLPVMFKELQEWDAKNFTRYAAIPFHMLRMFDLKDPNLIEHLERRFVIPRWICEERMRKLRERILHFNSQQAAQ